MLREWPVCPRPEHDEALGSWIERVGREYGMSAGALVNSIDPGPSSYARWPTPPSFQRLYNAQFVDRLVHLGRLSPFARATLWPPITGWELRDLTFRAHCPLCCLEDIRAERTPYGRQCWLQSWCTLCPVHRYPLVAHVRRATSAYEATWSADEIRQDMEYLTADRYRPLKAPNESRIRCVMLGSLLEIERAIAEAIEGNAPNRLSWGGLTAQEFLTVVDDVTTWSLTHFEPVSAWSRAEDLTAVEEQEGYGIVGRCRRQGRPADRTPRGNRSLGVVTHPKVRGAALWVAHALLAASHEDASDRPSGSTPQERQLARISGSAPAGQQWLADRQERWPSTYRRHWWTDVRQVSALPPHRRTRFLTRIIEIVDAKYWNRQLVQRKSSDFAENTHRIGASGPNFEKVLIDVVRRNQHPTLPRIEHECGTVSRDKRSSLFGNNPADRNRVLTRYLAKRLAKSSLEQSECLLSRELLVVHSEFPRQCI